MESKHLTGNEINRDEWAEMMRHSSLGGFFTSPDYMDIIAPGWSAVEVREGNKLVGVLPLNIRSKFGIAYSLQPPFAQYWGIIHRDPTPSNAYKSLSWKRKVVLAAIEGIPKKIRYFAHTFSPEFDYATPLHWKGFTLETRYTYRILTEKDIEGQWGALDGSKRNEILQSSSSGVEITVSEQSGPLLDLMADNLTEGKAVLGSASMATFSRLCDHLIGSGKGKIFLATHDHVVVAGGLFVDDGLHRTYLAGVQKNGSKKLGAMNLLLWEAIKQHCGPGRIFDFEGSMMEPIEAFFRGFGAQPNPYLFVRKNRLPILLRWIKK
jgi:hypothetical protein